MTQLDAASSRPQATLDMRAHLLSEFLSPPRKTRTPSAAPSSTGTGTESEKTTSNPAADGTRAGATTRSDAPAKSSTDGTAAKPDRFKSFFGDKGADYLDASSHKYLDLPDRFLAGLKQKSDNKVEPKSREKPATEDGAKKGGDTSVASADGKLTYTKLENGNWQFTDAKGKTEKSHPDFPDQAIKNVEKQEDGSIKLSLADGKIVRVRENGVRLHYPDEAAFKANHPNRTYNSDNTYRDAEWDANGLKSFKTSGKKDRFYQVAKDQWSSDPNASSGWKGHINIDGTNGNFERTCVEPGPNQGVRDLLRSDCINETRKPDGSMSVEVKFPEGKRTFHFKEGFSKDKDTLKQPESFEVERGGQKYQWKKVAGDNNYECNGEKRKAEVELRADGKYTFKDPESGWTISRTPDGRVEENTPKEKTYTVTEQGRLTKAKIGDQDFDIKYSADGKTSEIRHINENRIWTRDDKGNWKDAPLEAGKPYARPDDFEKKIVTSDDLDASQKARMLENVRAIRASKDYTDQEKAEVIKHAGNLLDGKGNDKFSAREKAGYADQLLWHISKQANDQGGMNNCNVTVLRGLSCLEKPSVLAKVTDEICNKGYFTTKDGTRVEPKLASIKPRDGSPEATFPPKDGQRTALGKLWDNVAINTYWTRATTDPLGNKVPRGSMWYEEGAPTGRADTGSRICGGGGASGKDLVLCKNKSGVLEPCGSPRLGDAQIADIWEQLSGEKLNGRFLSHANRGGGDVFKKLGGLSVSSEKEMLDCMKDGKWRIIGGNTGILEQKHAQQEALNQGKDPSTVAKPAGGEHVWFARYDAASNTFQIKNSWGRSYDMIDGSEAKSRGIKPDKVMTMSPRELYQSMQDPSLGGESYTLTWVWR